MLASCGATKVHTAAALPTGAKAAAIQAANAVTVLPAPGTPDACPRTPISFRGSPGTTVRSLHIVGSKSGLHLGRIEEHAGGAGASFLPRRRFRPGETVVAYAKVIVKGREANVGSIFRVGRHSRC